MLHFKVIVLFILICSIFGQQLQFLGPEPHRSYVSRSASAGSHVYQLTAISSSQGTVNYSIAQTDPSNPTLFVVDGNTGVITNAATYSGSPNQYSLVVEASLTGTPSVTANLTINVLPSYETAPQFEHSNIIVTIIEDSPVNTPVTIAQAFSLTSTSTRQYTLVSGNTNGDFNIGVTGIITTSNSLDRETVSQYNLIVRYIDDVGSVDTNVQILIQDLNDNSPTFNMSLYQFSINETPLYNTLIGTVSATDPDYGTNAFITYSLVGQHASQFIVTNDGKILTQAILDYEELSQYTLEVHARDAGSPILSSTAAIIISVNNQDDECPVFSGSLYIKDLPFDLLNPPLIDDYVLTVEANDPDNAGPVYYTLISGNNSTVFSLDSLSGNITLARNDDGIRDQYTLIISANDANCINKSLARVEIGIGSANEYSPVFTASSCTALLAENPVNGTIVATLVATDPDIGVNGKVRYDIVANIGDFMLFAVDSESGIVTTTASSSSYDRESRAGFQVGVTATDGGFRQDFCILSIELVDVNDNRPTFDLPDYSTNIDSTPGLGSYIIQVQAQDPDFGNNGDVSYSLVTENDCPFIIDSISGTIIVNNSVINPNHCSLTVTATDHGSPPLSGIATINITILHQGTIPIFNQSEYSVTIAENYGTSVAFITVKATLPGQGSIVYTMDMGSEYRTNSEGNFDVFDVSGGIYIVSNKPIDYEKLYPGPYLFRLLVRATSSNIFSVVVVTVHVTDVNDNFPVFPDVDGQPNTHPSVTFTVVEGQPPGPIGIVQAADNDTGINGIIYYKLNTITTLFSVSNNGTISSLIGGFDAENTSNYNFLVGAYNPGHQDKESVIDVNIVVEDINDNAPFFKESSYIVPLNETHLVHDMILKLVATDPDKNDQNNLIFAILSGNDEATFQIESSAGNGLLYLKRQLDYETQTQYILVIQVSDGVYTDTTTVSVQVFNVDDEPPVFSQSIYHATIVENAPLGTTVLQIEATDKDSNVIKFELKGLAEGRFLIDANGIITVNGTIDREEFLPGEQIVFLVFAYGGSLSTADIIVNVSDINDFVPKFLFSPFFGTAPENTDPGLYGLYIVQVKAVDFDRGSNGTIRYSLESGEMDGFQIDPLTGVIIANRTFDREKTRLFTLIAKAEDNGQPYQLFSTVEVVVEITDSNDNPPYWIYPYMYARVFENSPVGKVVIQLPASDPDNGINATVLFALTNGNAQGKFNLTSSTGEVTVAGSLDYENIGERRYFLYFSIQDAGSPSLSSAEIGELEIHVLDGNDHSPQFSTPVVNFEVAENALIGSTVHTLTATDEDTGSNSAINYTIISGNSDNVFSLLSHNNGSVSLIVSASLDYETTPSYSLSIVAFDAGYPPLSAQVTVNITITDVNDEPPLFTMNQYSVSIQEEMTAPTITLIYTEADDPDSDNIPGGLVAQYELISSDDSKQQFRYDKGWLSAVKRLDREEQAQYTFIVRAIDNDPVSPLTSTATIMVTVLDINDNPSTNGGHLDILIQSQNAIFPPQELGQVYFLDPDQNDTFQDCSITSGDDHVISVHTNCTLYLAITIPPNTMYSVTIQGRDGIHEYVITIVSLLLQNITKLPPISSLVTFTFNSSGSQYLDTVQSTLADKISTILSVLSSQVVILSAQTGHNDPLNTVDVSLAVREVGGHYRNITSIIHHLYVARQQLRFNDIVMYSIPLDPCLHEPCFNLGECQPITSFQSTATTRLASKWYILFTTRLIFSYQCSCLVGTSGDHCQENYNDCYSNPCKYGGICSDGLQDYTCQCPEGTSGKDCSINPDECLSNPCQNGATCINGFGKPVCECASGYYGNYCQYAYFHPSPHCDSNPCQHDSICSTGRDSFTCLCKTGFTGLTCQNTAQFQGGCVNNPCYNGSTCTDTSNGYTCTCSIGFTGPNCRFPLNNCELELCRNGGTCERGLYGSFRCLCPAGYGGDYCTELLSLCYSTPCHNGGTCIESEDKDSYSCDCNREHYGDHCQYFVNPPDLCQDTSCSNNATCSSGQGNYTCTCNDGTGGHDCSEFPNNPTLCDSNPCHYGGVCSINDSMFICQCPIGFTGHNCQINMNECISNPCLNSGACIDGFGSYICSCLDGFTGRNCDIKCPEGHIGEHCETDLNYCTPLSCLNGGTCMELANNYTCLCPPQYTGKDCDIINDCTVNICHHGGICMDSQSAGYQCQCEAIYKGDHCELLTVSFNGAPLLSSFRGYKTLSFRGQGTLNFEFATQSKDGLLLFNTQHQDDKSKDYIAVEIIDGYLVVKYSLGSDIPTNITVLSTSVRVTDGEWHNVEITITGKMLLVTLDYCIDLYEITMYTSTQLDCVSSVIAQTNYSYLDLGLPLYIGGIPLPFAILPNTSQGISACIRNLFINQVLLDLDNFVAQENSQSGCSQIEGSCNNVSCGNGTCRPQWNSYQCICPPQITGEHCTQSAEGLTFNGNTYVQFSLLSENGHSHLQTTFTQQLSNYQESISLWFRTEMENGILFLIGNITSEHIQIKLTSGRIISSINLGSQTTTVTSGSNLHNGVWHKVSITRIGLSVQLIVDNIVLNHTHSGPYFTLEYASNNLYSAGRPDNNGAVTEGYNGCIQDIRLDHTYLPTSGTNNFVNVSYVGDTPEKGCQVGPCWPNPCHTGNCSEITTDVYLCTCPNGETKTSPCEPDRGNVPFGPIAIAIAMAVFVIILLTVLIIGLVLIARYARRNKKYPVPPPNNNQLNQFEVHANVFTYDDEGGGEEDTHFDQDNELNLLPKPEVDSTSKLSQSISTLERVRKSDKMTFDTIPSTKNTPPISGTTPPVRGTPSSLKQPIIVPLSKGIPSLPQSSIIGTPPLPRPKTPPRASTPDINAAIEQKVNYANNCIASIDSVQVYSDEGLASSTGSLSTLCSSTNGEPYTIATLRAAGPEFQYIADLLEPVYMTDESDSGMD